jgi:hypothetical protein
MVSNISHSATDRDGQTENINFDGYSTDKLEGLYEGFAEEPDRRGHDTDIEFLKQKPLDKDSLEGLSSHRMAVFCGYPHQLIGTRTSPSHALH